jgi:hypothetical protein
MPLSDERHFQELRLLHADENRRNPLVSPKHRRLGFGLVAIGIGYVIDVLTYGRRWMRRRMSAGGSSSAQIDFYEDRIFMETD